MLSVDDLLQLEGEAQATQQVLERVPEDKLGWKPHDKSMRLGQLDLHCETKRDEPEGIEKKGEWA